MGRALLAILLVGGGVFLFLALDVPRRARLESFHLTVGLGLTRTGAWSIAG